MRVHVAFTPSEAATAELGIVVDVVRATSSIAQALASGYRRVLCCAEVEQARAARAAGDVAILCAGFKGSFAFDDAYCAGRIVATLGDGGVRTDAAIAAEL